MNWKNSVGKLKKKGWEEQGKDITKNGRVLNSRASSPPQNTSKLAKMVRINFAQLCNLIKNLTSTKGRLSKQRDIAIEECYTVLNWLPTAPSPQLSRGSEDGSYNPGTGWQCQRCNINLSLKELWLKVLTTLTASSGLAQKFSFYFASLQAFPGQAAWCKGKQ